MIFFLNKKTIYLVFFFCLDENFKNLEKVLQNEKLISRCKLLTIF